MAATRYFVRSKGKISGPFDVAALQKLIKRGMLSRMDEVSSDRVSWTGATQFDELFPARVHATEADPAPVGAAVAQAPAPPRTDASRYFYAQNGTTVGPVPSGVLQALAQNGTLGPDDLVWPEGAQSASPAAQLPLLISVFSGPLPHQSSAARSRPLSEGERVRCQQILHSTSNGTLISGVVIGCLLLLFLNLPLGTKDGKSTWWWDVLKEPKSSTAAVLLFFVLFSGIVTCATGASTRGVVRAWTFVGIAGLSFILFLVVGLTAAETDGGYFFSLIIPYLAACVLGLCYFRSLAPQDRAGAIFQGIFAGLLLFFTLIVAIVGLAQNSSAHMRPLMRGEQLPGWLVVALTIGALGLVAAFTAGILGLVLLKPRFSTAVNWSCAICAMLTLLLPSLAAIIAASGIVDLGDFDRQKKGLFIFLFFRILAIFLAFVMTLAVGMMELFTISHFRPLVSPASKG